MPDRPDILWIVTTQWRAQACGYAGDPNARTPRLDALAAASVNFAQAVTPHPFGPFARAAMLTGIPSPENGVRNYFDALPRDARTIAHDLRDRDYSTAWFGKWHLGERDSSRPLVGEAHATIIVPPEARGGFEFWEGFESGFLLNDPWLHGTRLPVPVRFRGYQSDVLCERAGVWFGEAGDDPRPWFCVVSLEAPHPPYDSAPDEPYDPATLELAANVPCGGEVEARARRELAGYYAHIAATDRAIGGMLDRLATDAPSRMGNTIVVFTSVHGDMHGAHGLFRKGWPFEESMRVPFLVQGPGAAPDRSDAPVSLLDLPAMTRAWADEEPWMCVRETVEISMPCAVPFRDQCDRPWQGTRSPHRKVVTGPDGLPWLDFDLLRDPDEMCNRVEPGLRTLRPFP